MAAGLAAGLSPEAVFVLGDPAEAAVRLADAFGVAAPLADVVGGPGPSPRAGAPGPSPLAGAPGPPPRAGGTSSPRPGGPGSLSRSPLADTPVYAVDARVAAKLSTLETPAPVMAVFAVPEAPALSDLRAPKTDELLRTPGLDELRGPTRVEPLGTGRALVVYADGLADPGNLGTLVRAAAAFAAAALIASPGSVDLFSPKVVRASMGAVFALPLYQDLPLERAVAGLGAQAVYGLVAHGGTPIDQVDFSAAGPVLLVVGAERAGLSDEALAGVTDLVTIPLAGAAGPAVESLNAGVAGAIALYELSRRLTRPARTKGGAGAPGAGSADPAPGAPAPQKE